MGKFYINKALPQWVSRFLGTFLIKKYLKFTDQTTHEVLSSLTKNETLIKVLTAQYGDYGLPPRQSSFAMHASVAKHYFDGGSFPIGGSGAIVSTVNEVLEAHGAQIMTNAEVAEIRIERGKVLGVKMQDGKEIAADQVVSGVGIFNTYEQLMPETIRAKHEFDVQLQKIQPSVGHGCLYIGLKGSPESLELTKNNLWIYPEGVDHDQAVVDYLEDQDRPFPVVYISFPAAKHPSWNARYPNRSTIDVITLLPYEAFAQWEGTQWMHRGAEYEALKEQITQRLLAHLLEQLTHLKDHIDHYELSTPLTTKNFANYQKGELYGIDHSPSRYRQKFLQPRTPIKGLYLTGQDIVTAGVGRALFSGLITASTMTGRNYMKKVMGD
jgi:all-trans-retinol 13,14-reductase